MQSHQWPLHWKQLRQQGIDHVKLPQRHQFGYKVCASISVWHLYSLCVNKMWVWGPIRHSRYEGAQVYTMWSYADLIVPNNICGQYSSKINGATKEITYQLLDHWQTAFNTAREQIQLIKLSAKKKTLAETRLD